MPTPSTAKWPLPRSEDEWEEMALDALRILWRDPSAQRHGRRGQRQNGVDISGENHTSEFHGVVGAQCKNSDEIDMTIVAAEIRKAEAFVPKLAKYYLVVAGARDGRLEEQVRQLSWSRRAEDKFGIAVLFADDIVQELAQSPALVRKHWAWPHQEGEVHVHLSVLNGLPAAHRDYGWSNADETEASYSLEHEGLTMVIKPTLPYADRFDAGGPISPLRYMTPTYTPFMWEFPVLDVKILNTTSRMIFLTEVELEVVESVPDQRALLTLEEDVYGSQPGGIRIRNEGGQVLRNVSIEYRLDSSPEPCAADLPFRAHLGDVSDDVVVSVIGAAHTFPTDSFPDGKAFASGWIAFDLSEGEGSRRRVRFEAQVALFDTRRYGVLAPPEYHCSIKLEVEAKSYKRVLQLSQKVPSNEAARFTMRLGVAGSSVHQCRLSIRDIARAKVMEQEILLKVFVPRSTTRTIQALWTQREKHDRSSLVGE